MSTVAVSRMTTKGQVTVPQEVREEFHLEAGDLLEWTAGEGGRIEVRKLEGRLEDLVGLLGNASEPVTIEQMDEAIRDRFRRKHARG